MNNRRPFSASETAAAEAYDPSAVEIKNPAHLPAGPEPGGCLRVYTTGEGKELTIHNRSGRGSALALRRQEAYQRLADIDAYRLILAGGAITNIAGRANTTPWLVRRWLREVAACTTDAAEDDPPTCQSDAVQPASRG
jgi:hypothetical protein